MTRLTLNAGCVLFSIASIACAQAVKPASTVVAGPASWSGSEKLDPAAHYVLTVEGGKPIPAQADAENRLWWIADKAATAGAGLTLKKESSPRRDRVKVEVVDDEHIRVTLDGKPFTTLNHVRSEPRPYLYPVLGPTGDPMTRAWPMEDVPAEKEAKQQDHDHHRSIWTAHGDIRTPLVPKKTSYWETDAKKDGKVAHRPGTGWQKVAKVVRITSGPVFGEIVLDVDWVTDDPQPQRQLFDTRTYRFFRSEGNQIVFDYHLVLHFPESDVTFAPTKEGGLMSVRIPVSMTEKPGKGHMVNSEGKKGMDECWAEPAKWCDYVGPVNDKTVGIAIFDGPKNFRHPVRWHIRNYGLYTANPFIGKSDKKDMTEDGSVTWKKGENVAFDYRVILHTGDTAEAKIAEQYATYGK